ncbi:MAG: hypothetical protein ABSH50_03480 [Bryobacteraceae bacterium]|jgi:hypothetical protein
MRRLTGAVFLAMSLGRLCGADSEPRWITLNHAAHQAAQSKDYPALRDALTGLQALLPGNARILYKLADAEARLGHNTQALAELADLAAAGLIYDFAADEDFASLRATPQFAAILRQTDRNRQPVGHAVAVQLLPEPDLLPEDLAYDPKTHRFLIGSVTQSKIVTGEGRLFAQTGWPVMALRIDSRRRILWAATGWVGHCAHCNLADKDKSALLAFHLDSGALIRRIESPVKGLFGDMAISRAGDLYVSEGTYGAVLRLTAGASTFDRLDPPGEFPSPQTPALSADEHTLYVPDYVRGIAAIDLQTRALRWLQPAPKIVLSGIDGFYRYGNSFLAVQNGETPERLVLFSADLTRQRILETNTPGLGEPTHGTFVGDTFYFIANTGWNEYDDEGRKKPGSPRVESELRKIDMRHLAP